jgi:serine/threonine protein phosphatase PrpC
MQARANLIERVTQAYVTYRGVRLLCAALALLSAPLLFVLSGGFPPYAWRLLAQALMQLPTLLTTRGSGVLLALLGIFLLSATILIAWGALLWLCWRMFAYWRYERQELRNFAADVQEAQFQAEELDEYAADQYADEEEPEEVHPVLRQPVRPPTRRRVMYPLTPLVPLEEETAQEGAPVENDGEPFFIEEDEEESMMSLYRDVDDEEEMVWSEFPHGGKTLSPVPQAEAASAGAVYDQQIVEHSSPSPAVGNGDNVAHTSYGRILPFSAAPSAGALPHLTTALYNRVPLPRSVAPRSTDPLSAPAQAERPGQRIEPTQPIQANRPPVQPVRPVQPPPAHSTKQAVPAQSVAPAAKQAAPTQSAGPAAKPPTPPQMVARSADSSQRPLPARPTKQQVAPPAPRSVLARPTNKLTALPQSPVSQNAPAQSQGPQGQHSAMQSLVELISTVPLTPPQAPIPIARPLVRSEATERRPTTQLVVSTGLDVGLKRRGKPNEDSLLALQNTRVLRGNSCPVGLFVVADGMGGHDNGQEASHLVIQSLSRTVVPSIIYGPTDDNYAELLAEGVHHANLEVYQRNRQVKADMGTTIVAALVVDSTAYVVSAGDSRVYLYRSTSGLTRVTRDHSTVARLVESGLIKPEEVYTHPRRNEIYRSLGHHPSEDLDKFILALQPEDVLLLCSDGLWEMVRDEHIREIIASTASQPAQTSAALVQAALDGGGKDNISVIVVYVKAAMDAQSAWAG